MKLRKWISSLGKRTVGLLQCEPIESQKICPKNLSNTFFWMSLAFILVVFSVLQAAEYRDGELFIEVLLCSGQKISIAAASGNADVCFSEVDLPISRILQTPLNISLDNPATLLSWGYLERVEPWHEDSDGHLRESFQWQDSSLMIHRENLVFASQSFADKASAVAWTKANSKSEKQITALPMQSPTVCVSDRSGNKTYLETPLHFTSAQDLQLAGVKLGFSGEFILKIVGSNLVVTHFLPLDEYVAGVVPNEIGAGAPLEALKAQAVAARTHAVGLLLNNRHKNDGYDLCNTTHCQVYKGKYQQNAAVRDAVFSTQNQILILPNRIADTTYHSACGGKTDSSGNIWGGETLLHLVGVECFADAASLDFKKESDARTWISDFALYQGGASWENSALSWNTQISSQQLAKNLGLSKLDHLVINRRGNSGRIIDITFYGNKTVRLNSEYKIRQAFGNTKSSFFYIKGPYVEDDQGRVVIYPGGTLSLYGRGSGHGVGMCQIGALRMAREGRVHHEILTHYYPGTQIWENWMEHDTR